MTTKVVPFLRASRSVCLATLLVFVFFPFQTQAQVKRHDVVIMKNGDHITGDIKRLENGLLYVDTTYVTDSIALDWNQVKSVKSSATFQIVLNNGKRLRGTIERTPVEEPGGRNVLIHEPTKDVRVSSAEVTNFDISKPTFWRQLQGSVDFGYDFTSGSDQTTLNVNANTMYETPRWSAGGRYSSTFSSQSGGSRTNNEDLSLTWTGYLNRNSFLMGLSGFLHSTQQDLKLRTTLGGGYGRYLMRTTNSNLTWLGGAVYVQEMFDNVNGETSDQNMEGVAGLQYKLARFNFGNANAQLFVFP